ncbi:hypothetical protein R5W24_000511 [Gemmata sp. JC717]|uniref:hypothetical protein n=1 Tax=Gemmata algarum TaxID=2975278 RepID=UPI0021BB7212|nr:hypothetical protein [Gemmata algarum]MDY3551435.1 hypothetical protein [Gemmata algarum]
MIRDLDDLEPELSPEAKECIAELEVCQEIVVDCFEVAVNSLIRHEQAVSLNDLLVLMDTIADALHDRAKPFIHWLESNGYDSGEAPWPNEYRAYVAKEHARMVKEINEARPSYARLNLRPVSTNPGTKGSEW